MIIRAWPLIRVLVRKWLPTLQNKTTRVGIPTIFFKTVQHLFKLVVEFVTSICCWQMQLWISRGKVDMCLQKSSTTTSIATKSSQTPPKMLATSSQQWHQLRLQSVGLWQLQHCHVKVESQVAPRMSRNMWDICATLGAFVKKIKNGRCMSGKICMFKSNFTLHFARI